ncbi:Zinc finger, C2CH-type,Harbinger transposase-derived nuclease domain,Transposase, Helix-turn-helix [Cinara cedri]|uniref:Zinc finger, C2CH-type,Harbinger transposase-derived nuclease domain,Transposase, Helix-turn-helix n=1 Tax=Cinara cedri TaxID=506608 RepID=A0A5E4NS49_9HEMI|nr:Zinc finger, C2CH-type,Harbinger transposase-derived nuclease domain,Transposase, Helix-turn-helix [Cinara cedri]
MAIRTCCIIGCQNTNKNTSNITFYSFPGRPQDKELKQKWIEAVNRLDEFGNLWQPKSRSYICSAHFVNNQRSRLPLSPSYIPSIFPIIYNKTTSTYNGSGRNRLVRDFSSQVNFNLTKVLTFGCTVCGNNVFTHVNVPLNNLVSKTSTNFQVSVANFPFLPNSNLFQSFSTNRQLKDFTGVSFGTFYMLLSFLPESLVCTSINKENSLLLFLMKFKIGFNYSALGVLFKINHQTAANIFCQYLTLLVDKTKHIITWPSTDTVLATLPKCFKKNYTNCRCIVNIFELEMEEPISIEQRVYTYLSCKNYYASKVLIAVTPSEMVCYLSECFGGTASDSLIINKSGLFNLLAPGDFVIANKDLLGIESEYGNIKSFSVSDSNLHNGRLLINEVLEANSVESVKRHIKGIFAKLKAYNILLKIPTDLIPFINDIVRICCVLYNLEIPIIID